MFNWFDKLLVKIAKKILNKYAPTGEFIAYINEQEEKVLKKLGGYGQPINETGIKSFIPQWMIDIANKYTKYKPLVDTAIGLGKGYLDYKSQKELNELSEEAYRQYMLDKEAAGQEAQAAIDLNLTPMEIVNVPRSKADVTSSGITGASDYVLNPEYSGGSSVPTYGDPFSSKQDYMTGFETWKTANPDELAKAGHSAMVDVTLPGDYEHQFTGGAQASNWQKYLESIGHAPYQKRSTTGDLTKITNVARGGLMNLPTRHRKRYYGGTDQEDIEIMEPESLGDFELQMEEGVNIGEQVFHDTGDDRTNAQNVWDSGAIDQEIYQLNFELFFNSGDWQDHISRGTVQGDTQMAKGPEQFMTNEEMTIPNEEIQSMISTGQQVANGGIIGLRYGGRPGYQFGIGPQQGMMPQQGIMPQGMMPQGMMPQQGLRPGYEMGLGPVGRGMGPEEIETESEYISTRDNDTFEVDTINRIYEEQGNDGLQAYLERNPDLKDKYVIVTDGMSGELTVMPNKLHPDNMDMEKIMIDFENLAGGNAKGGLPKRVRKAPGGIMDLGGLEKDYRTTGGFVPIGGRERADDVPARLSKNEFVMTADAVRAAGGGSINKGAQRMYDTMKHLEASPQSNRMIA